MAKFRELKEDWASAIAQGIAQGSYEGLRGSRTRPTDVPVNAGFRNYYRDPSSSIRTARLDRRLVKLLDDWCKEFGYNGYPTSKAQDSKKYGYDQFYKKRNGWTGSPRHVGGMATDMYLVKGGGSKLPIVNFERGTPESREFFQHMMRLNDMAKERGLRLSVGAGPGYMGAYTMHVDIARGKLQIPFPYPSEDGQLTTNIFRSEYGHKAWYKQGERTGVIRVETSWSPIWGNNRPAWLNDLSRHM